MTSSEQTAHEIVQFLNDHIDRVIPTEWYERIMEIVGRGEEDAKINLQSAKAEMPEGLWEESCGTVHVAIRILAKQSAELRQTVEMLLASAYPNAKEHPTMIVAWAKAREVLAGQRSTVEGQKE